MNGFVAKFGKGGDVALAASLMGILAVLIVPLPPIILDLLLTLGIAISIILLLTSVYAGKALDFSTFPSLLLVTTLFRLSLNVATTRAILLHGAENGTQGGGSGDP